MPNPMPVKKWYQTKSGKIFLVIIILLAAFVLIFAGFVAYYSWQIKYGDEEKLAQIFETSNITGTNVYGKESKPITEDMTKYVYANSPKFGSEKAPVTILAFIDFECPFSQQSYPIFKNVVEQYEPAIRVVFKHLPISSTHQNADKAHLASACAQEQNKFWEYYDLLFSRKKLDETSLIKYANELKLNMDQFNNCLKTEKFLTAIETDLADSIKLEVRGTPTYFVNQTRVEGVVPEEDWGKLILNQVKASK